VAAQASTVQQTTAASSTPSTVTSGGS
jgi:hypothetical protein